VLRIGVWNVEYALTERVNTRRRAIMRRNPADIWILTETRDTLRPLGRLAVHSRQRPYYGSSVKHRSRWVSIWSRLPVTARPVARGADRERTTSALIATPLGPLLVYGSVMPWNGDKGRMGSDVNASGWSRFFEVVPQQLRECRQLQQRFPKAALCLAGDFNCDMERGSYYGSTKATRLLETGLASLRAFCATGPGRVPRGWLEHLPIDHIALPISWAPHTRVVAAWEGRIGQPRLSDHSGVVVEIKPA
jgi:hypothetical protein